MGNIAKLYLEAGEAQTPKVRKDFSGFNEDIGLPLLPMTNQTHPLLPYQVELGSWLGDTITNKSNKIGVTEALLRKFAWFGVVGDCVGYQMMLGAQDRELAIENMRRLQAIFENSDVLRPLIRNAIATRLRLWNGTTYFVMPRRAAAMRGWPRLKRAFMDEASHSGLLDDEPLLSATSARLANTGGHIDVVSTPHGQRGFFYRLCFEAEQAEKEGRTFPYKYFKLPYTVALGDLIQESRISQERAVMPAAIFAQEYECAFVAGEFAAIEAELAGILEVDDYDLP